MIARSLRTDARPEVVGVVAAKGGSGQTTVALDWARAVGQAGKRCLLLEIAGGDLAVSTGATPKRFVEDVAAAAATPVEAAVSIGPGTDLIAAGRAWSIYGSSGDASLQRLTDSLAVGPWSHWVVDLGHTRPHRHHPVWGLCRTIAIVMQDDIACLTQSYALIRHLAACGWSGRIGLVLNRMSNGAQAERLRRHLDQITQAFMQFTAPVIGVVPDGDDARRTVAVSQWALSAMDGGESEGWTESRITQPAFVSDITV